PSAGGGSATCERRLLARGGVPVNDPFGDRAVERPDRLGHRGPQRVPSGGACGLDGRADLRANRAVAYSAPLVLAHALDGRLGIRHVTSSSVPPERLRTTRAPDGRAWIGCELGEFC